MMKALTIVKGVAILGAAFVAYKVAMTVKENGGKVIDAVKTVITEDLNPASDKNVVYSGVSSIGSKVSGDKDWTLGGAIYDLFNPDPMALMAKADASNVKLQGVQITSPDNPKTTFQQSEKRSLSYITGVSMTDGDDSSKNIVNGINFNNF